MWDKMISGNIKERMMSGKLGEVIRFGIVGGLATIIQYGTYYGLIQLIPSTASKADAHLWTTVAMTVGYIVSFIFNFIASTRYTFRVKANAKRGAGFLFSHIVNYCLQMLTLNFFLWLGLSKAVAPIPMFCICVPINFLLVRFFLKR
jgi:putative flippase GtrA